MVSIQCPHCSQEHPQGTLFCPVTGKELPAEKYCMLCGTRLHASWVACPNCGAEVSDALLSEVKSSQPLQKPETKPAKLWTWVIVLSLMLLAILAIILITIKFLVAPTPEPTSGPLALTLTLGPEAIPDSSVLPTMAPPLLGVNFPAERANYPADWPEALHYPEDFILVETSSGSLAPGEPLGWAAKLRIKTDPKSAADLLSAYFVDLGWEISSREELDSGGVLVLIEKNEAANQGILVLDPDGEDPAYTLILATVFP